MVIDILWQCARCHLLWVDPSSIPTECPRCARKVMIPSSIMVAGRDVRVKVVKDYGLRKGLMDPEVRKGLAKIPLDICPHGFVTSAICPEC